MAGAPRPTADAALTELYASHGAGRVHLVVLLLRDRGQAAAPVVASGLTCTFEGAVSWEVRSQGTLVRDGTTTASSGCPQQGSWSVDLGLVPAGPYELHTRELSATDGSVVAEVVVPFSVG